MSEPSKYWFPAKRYGWGWGLPRTWQGWLVLLAFALLVAAGGFLLLPARTEAFVAWTLLWCLALYGVCRAKGEPARWRWGGR